jgi:8-oxo-dGTP pyrophosphatase MutT (NUDIX family)
LARASAIVNALKSTPGGARPTYAPQSSGMGRISPIQAEMYYNNSYANTYGPFLPRDPRVFTDGAFAPMSPIQPTPVDEPSPGATFPGPRWWQYRNAWNLPTPPGSEGLKLASFDQLRTLAQKYSVARAAIEIRIEEIRGLRWDITLTTDAAKAYQGDRNSMRDFGERKAKAMKFFRRPDPDFWNFDSFLSAFLEEIFVYDALALIFRPKYGASFGMGGRGLLGSDLDSLNLVSGPTIRPLIDMHGGHPRPPAPAYQQFLYGVPRSDYMTLATGSDIDDAGLAGAEVNEFNADIMLYAPYWATRETPYGFPPVERALLPIISGLQKQEFQLDYFTEGTVPAVYISPGDSNITPTQIGELQNALNALAGDPAYHLKVVVLPPGSKVEPQRPVDLSDSFDYLVMNQVCMAFDVQPQELGIIPDIGGTPTGPSASGVRFSGQESRDVKSRKSTLPLLKWTCDIFNYILQDICDCPDMQFEFEGLVNDEDKQAITSLGVEQVQNGIASIDEVRDRLDMPPWGLQETSEPIVMTPNGPIPFSMAPQLIQAMLTQGQDSGSSKSGARPKKGTSATKPNGSHSAPVSPPRQDPSATPQHIAAQGATGTLRPQRGATGGTGRAGNNGSRKRGQGLAPTQGRLRNKAAAASELDALRRHLRKGREITTWEPVNITNGTLARIAEDLAKGVLLDTAIERAGSIAEIENFYKSEVYEDTPTCSNPLLFNDEVIKSQPQFPGWQQDLGLVGQYKEQISQAFQDAEIKGSQIRKDAASGKMYVSSGTLHGLISDATKETFLSTMTPMWEKAWDLGYDSAVELVNKTAFEDNPNPILHARPADRRTEMRQAFLDTEGVHWLEQISRTGLGNSGARSEMIARTEIARAMNAGVIEAYRDCGVSYKHLLIAPDERACEICKDAADDGVIPLDASFSSGGISGPCHIQCRCIPGPAGIDVEPPQGHIGKHFMTIDEARQIAREDDSRVAWLLIRARDDDGKWRYLLQQRDDGTWGMPGGTAHVGEEGFTAAFRETTEEVGELPHLDVVHDFTHIEEDGSLAYLYLCESAEMFTPQMNGSTPEETAGTGWFRRKEISELNLTPKFRDDWESTENPPHLEQALKDQTLKVLQNVVNEMGERLTLDDRHGAGMGSRWPYPQRGGQEWPDAGPGAVPGPSAGGEPPRSDPDHADTAGAHLYPRGSQDDKYPRRRGRNRPASRFPDADSGEGDKYPAGGNSDPGPDAISVGSPKAAAPVVGTVPAKTPKPATPHPAIPETYDTSTAVLELDPDLGENVIAGKSVTQTDDERLADPRKPGGPSDYDDPNETDPEHILSQMRSNFPEAKIQWVKNARWIGPVEVPWERVDSDSIETWAASHQPDAVNRFARDIKENRGHTNPSILIQRPGNPKALVIDGHHRALARRKLGKPVLAYVGFIQAKDALAAEETHASQFHSGADPGNR